MATAEWGCVVCGNDDTALDRDGWCDACIDWDRHADIEGHEERRRAQLAEAAEH